MELAALVPMCRRRPATLKHAPPRLSGALGGPGVGVAGAAVEGNKYALEDATMETTARDRPDNIKPVTLIPAPQRVFGHRGLAGQLVLRRAKEDRREGSVAVLTKPQEKGDTIAWEREKRSGPATMVSPVRPPHQVCGVHGLPALVSVGEGGGPEPDHVMPKVEGAKWRLRTATLTRAPQSQSYVDSHMLVVSTTSLDTATSTHWRG